MQTNFTEFQLADPTLARADAMLKRCVHCGFCIATCPTYVLTGDERDSPRGRIYFIKEMFEQGQVTPAITRHIDRCLSCFSCMTTCPSGVDYMHLLDLARARIEVKGHRSLSMRAMRALLANVLPNRNRFRLMLLFGWLAKPLTGLLAAIGLKRNAAALGVVPSGPRVKLRKPKSVIRTGERRVKRVALMLG